MPDDAYPSWKIVTGIASVIILIGLLVVFVAIYSGLFGHSDEEDEEAMQDGAQATEPTGGLAVKIDTTTVPHCQYYWMAPSLISPSPPKPEGGNGKGAQQSPPLDRCSSKFSALTSEYETTVTRWSRRNVPVTGDEGGAIPVAATSGETKGTIKDNAAIKKKLLHLSGVTSESVKMVKFGNVPAKDLVVEKADHQLPVISPKG